MCSGKVLIQKCVGISVDFYRLCVGFLPDLSSNIMALYNWIATFLPMIQIVASQQSFFRQPTNESATQGSTVVLRCIVKNKGNGAVQWTRGGFGLGIEKSLPEYQRYMMIGPRQTLGNGDTIEEFSLKIVNLQLEDDERYQCQVMWTEQHQGIVSQYAWINVLIPPDRPTLEKGLTIPVILNRPTNVTCRALNGKPKSQIKWKKDDIPITENTYEIASTQLDGKRVDTTGIVTINATFYDAGKKIECGAWNEALSGGEPKWAEGTLDVQYAPIIELSHNNPDRTMREFDNIKFTCTGKANPYEITWKWYRNGELLEDEHRNILEIPGIKRDYHGDIIKCEAINTVGSTTVEHSMNILYGPKFKNEAMHVSVDAGQRAELRCEADGNPTAEITWSRKGKFQILHSSSTYVIPRVQEGMFGVYTCTATVLGFNQIIRDVYLTENGPPEIVSDARQYSSVGDTTRLECMTISSPKPTFVWSMDGYPIDYALSGRFSAPQQDLPYGGKGILQILDTQREDFGIYNCTVYNGKGSAVMMISLEEKEVLPMPVIIGGAAGGVAVIAIIILACVIYHKCRHSDNESYAETDSNTEIKKRDKNESPSEMTKSTLMEQWRQDYNYRYSADFDDIDATKGNNNGQYNTYNEERYGTMPTSGNYQNGQIFTDRPEEILGGTLNRYETSYSTGYIPSTFRSPSRTDFNNGRVSATDFTSGRVSTTDFTGRVSTEPLEPFRLPAADYSTSKLATNV